MNCGIYEDGLNPLTMRRIYNAVVLPKSLLGARCGPISMLLIKHRSSGHTVFVSTLCNSCQKLLVLTSPWLYLALTRFVRNRNRLPETRIPGTSEHRVKHVFLHRLIHHNESPAKILGFFPDIYSILSKYALTRYLIEYIENGTFLSKYAWKKSALR